jgi:histidinol-phosphate aminotransferase
VTISPQQLLRAELANMQAYQVANSEGLIKLDAMENPYSFPASLQEQWLSTLKELELNRYPDPQASQLKQDFRTTYAVSSNLEMLFGNGSDELIQLLILAIAKPDACILTVTPSFSMYKIIAEFVGVRVIEVPLTAETFALQTNQVCKKIQQHKPALVFLACPNNPTGTLWPQAEVEKIVQQSSGLVVIDEAYAPFAAYSMLPLVEKYSHVLMLRTLSKMGLAGLRLGWLLGAEQWLSELNKLRLPYNINALTQASASLALNNISIFDAQAKLICQQRQLLSAAMQEIEGLQVFPSEANFILFKTLNSSAEIVFKRLIDNKILIKFVANNKLLDNCLRVTVGAENENRAFIAALKNSLF